MNEIGISLGWNCHSAVWGVNVGIRKQKHEGYKTCPFDEMMTTYKGIVDCLNDDFENFYDENYFEMKQEMFDKDKYVILNNKYNFIFNHESPGHADLYIQQNWPEGINHFINNNFHHFTPLNIINRTKCGSCSRATLPINELKRPLYGRI